MAEANSTPLQIREDRAIYRALQIVRQRLSMPGPVLSKPSAVRSYLALALTEKDHEVFLCLFLDVQNRLIADEILFHGTLTNASVYPREVVRRAMHHNAAGVIFAHNHPTGLAEPSFADKHLTEILKSALVFVDVMVLDHFIVAADSVFSFLEAGILNNPVPQAEPQKPVPERKKKHQTH